MTDDKLLDLAAGVAENVRWDGVKGCYCQETEDANNPNPEWNPIEDDGDAFRLAVYLEMEINRATMKVKVCSRIGTKPRYIVIPIDAEVSKDKCAATRLAIVVAAAAVAQGWFISVV